MVEATLEPGRRSRTTGTALGHTQLDVELLRRREGASMAQGEAAVARALAQVVDDHGWLVATEHARLRAALVDVLGGQADEHRGSLDAIVIAAEEGVATEVRRAGRPLADDQRATLTARLEEWGLDGARAAWVVEAWEALAPQVTAPAPIPVPAPDPAPAPVSPAPGRATSPQPGTVPEVAATQLPPSPPAADPAPGLVPPVGARPARSGRAVVVVAALLVLLVCAGVGAYALTRNGDEQASTDGDGSTTGPATSAATQDVTDAAPPASEGALASGAELPAGAAAGSSMVSLTGGVRIARVGRVEEADFGEGTRSAPEGGSLLVFRLADAPCEGDRCTPWRRLGLRILVSSAAERLPAGGDTFVLAVPAGDDPELAMRIDGFRQTLSLGDGEPGPANIAVLARRDRVTRIGASFTVPETTSGVLPSGTAYTDRAEREVRVTSADLEFFAGGTHPAGPGQAFLKVRADYGVAGAGVGRYAFEPGEISFVSDEGRRYDARDLDPGDATNAVFVVPATLTGGTFVVGGTRTTTAVDGSAIRVVVGEHRLRIRLD